MLYVASYDIEKWSLIVAQRINFGEYCMCIIIVFLKFGAVRVELMFWRNHELALLLWINLN